MSLSTLAQAVAPKDGWDKAQIIAGALVPLAILVIGMLISRSQTKLSDRNERLRTAISCIEPLAEGDARRKKILAQVVLKGLSERPGAYDSSEVSVMLAALSSYSPRVAGSMGVHSILYGDVLGSVVALTLTATGQRSTGLLTDGKLIASVEEETPTFFVAVPGDPDLRVVGREQVLLRDEYAWVGSFGAPCKKLESYANIPGEMVLVGYEYTGESPAGSVRVLAGQVEPGGSRGHLRLRHDPGERTRGFVAVVFRGAHGGGTAVVGMVVTQLSRDLSEVRRLDQILGHYGESPESRDA